MAGSKQCPKCSSSMSEGFIVDHTQSGTAVAGWVEGQPVKSVWTGLKLGGRARFDIAAWRCGRCGFIEYYASGASTTAEAEHKKLVLVIVVVAAVVAGLAGAVMVAVLAP